MDVLIEAALSTSVHADALDAAVSNLKKITSTIDEDQKRLESLTADIESLKEELARVQEVDSVRGKHVQASKPQKLPTKAAQPGPRDLMAFVKGAREEDELPSQGTLDRESGNRPGGVVGELSDMARSLASEIDKRRAELTAAENSTLRAKLQRLERGKAAAAAGARKVNAVHDAIDNYEFPPEFEMALVCGAAVDSDRSQSIIDGAISRAAVRLSDALELITNVSQSDDPMQVHAAWCYKSLTSDPDVGFLMELSQLPEDALPNHFAKVQSSFTASAPATFSTSTADPTSGSSFAVSDWHYDFLPPRLAGGGASSLLRDIQPRYLEPMQHITTRRYTYESVGQLRRVEKLRWELRNRLLTDAITGNAEQQLASAGPADYSVVKSTVSTLRGGSNWPVIARIPQEL